MAHLFTTPTVAGSGDTIHFGSLEFPALPLVGMRVPPVFEPSQAFLLGSLDFVADRLDVLHLREEALVPAPVGGAPRAVTMLLRGLPEPNDPQEQVIHRNLWALVETTAVQQVECSISRRRLMSSLSARGTRT